MTRSIRLKPKKRRQIMKRRKGIAWDYNLDGASGHEEIKGFWKRYWMRWLRREKKAGVL